MIDPRDIFLTSFVSFTVFFTAQHLVVRCVPRGSPFPPSTKRSTSLWYSRGLCMPFSSSPIVLVDDDERFRRSFVDYFRRHGLTVLEAGTVEEAESIIAERVVAMAIVDWKLPGTDGITLCTRLRLNYPQLPLILLTARADLDSQLEGFTYGIDDYWPKPYPLSLAAAKARSILRRALVHSTSEDPFMLGNVTIDLRRRVIIRNNNVYAMKDKEYGILRVLAMEDGAPVRRETLLSRVWGYDALPVTRTVDNYIVSLRRKIEEDVRSPRYLLTVGGVGYRLNKDS